MNILNTFKPKETEDYGHMRDHLSSEGITTYIKSDNDYPDKVRDVLIELNKIARNKKPTGGKRRAARSKKRSHKKRNHKKPKKHTYRR
jgi:hypothetical protein